MSDRKLLVNCAKCGERKTGNPAKGMCWGCWHAVGVRVKMVTVRKRFVPQIMGKGRLVGS